MMPAMAAPRRKTWIVWLALGVVGVLAVVPAVVVGIRTLAETVAAPSRSTPGTFEVTLDAGDHAIFEQIAAAGDSFSSAEDDTSLTPEMVSITAPAGKPVEVEASFGAGTITQGATVYRSTLTFEAPVSGRYAIEVRGEPGAILVTPSLAAAFGRVVPWLALAGLGVLAAFAGGIGLMVSPLRRTVSAPAEPAPVAPAAVPAGWYVDPGGSGRWRYWDGSWWTADPS